jgi:hypothetical protein
MQGKRKGAGGSDRGLVIWVETTQSAEEGRAHAERRHERMEEI